ILVSKSIIGKQGEERNHSLPIDVVLYMFISLISYPYRLISLVSFEIIQSFLRQFCLSHNPIQRLEPTGVRLGDIRNISRIFFHFFKVANMTQGSQYIVTIPQPTKPVIPIS